METCMVLKNFVVTPIALLGVCFGLSIDVPDAEGDMQKIGQSRILASHYASKALGEKTDNGESYNPAEMTAAHRSLPFGTRLRIDSPSHNKSVIVRVNDRGPFVLDHDLDLSTAAASKLDLKGNNVEDVLVTVLRE